MLSGIEGAYGSHNTRPLNSYPPAFSENYREKIEAFAAVLPPRPGTVMEIAVLHEPECRRPQGGPCYCKPAIGLRGGGEWAS